MAKKQKKIQTNKLVAYIRNDMYDTPLDDKGVQLRRIHAWADEYGYEVVDYIYDEGRSLLDGAFKKASDLSGKVIVASVSRVANKPTEFLQHVEGVNSNLVSAETLGNTVKFGQEPCEFTASHTLMALTMELGFREKYISEYNKWVG